MSEVNGEATSEPPCVCAGPGFCARYGIRQNARTVELCRTQESYRRKWRLAGGVAPGPVASATPPRAGTGVIPVRFAAQPVPPKSPARPSPCVHLGRTLELPMDGGRVCRAYHECEQGRGRVRPAHECQTCPAYEAEYDPAGTAAPPTPDPPATLPVTGWTRHLIYYVYPVAGNSVWQCNVDQLLERIDLFDGRRVVAIARQAGVVNHHPERRGQRPPHAVDPPERVRERLAPYGFSFVELDNDGRLGEAAAFVALLERVRQYDGPGDVTFYAHAKGVTRPVNPGVSVHPWASLLYGANLDHWPAVERVLQSHPTAGAFKVVGKPAAYPGHVHYSGTFFWFRNRDVFGRPNWRAVPAIWGGVEAWPGVLFAPHEAGCVFWEEPIQPVVTGYHFPRLRVAMARYAEWAAAEAAAGIYSADPRPWMKWHGYE